MGLPTATVRMVGPDGIARTATGMGTGPVDAAYKAIDALVRVPVDLVDYSVSSVSAGIEALATTRVVVRPAGRLANAGYVESARGGTMQRNFSGSGTDEDIVVASARAFVSALNKTIAHLSAGRVGAEKAEAEKAEKAEGEVAAAA